MTAGGASWYDKTWVLVLSLVCCFPLGLVLVWSNKKFTQKTKLIITGIVLVLVVVGAISDAAGTPDEEAATSTSTTVEKAPPTTAPTTSLAPRTTQSTATTAVPTTTRPPATTAAPTTAPPPTRPALTVSQEQAVRAAQSYLDMSGFSRQGLIAQLSSEYGNQFSVEDATFAVDSLSVDWNAEAVESARSYIELSAFSCQGLIDQLSSEYGSQFTVDQARYAASQVGLC